MKTQNNSSSSAVLTAQVSVMRSPEALAGLLTFGDNESVSLVRGSAISADEIAEMAISYAKSAQSAGLRAANILRLAKGLPAVSVIEDGKEKKVNAFNYACDKVRASLATDSAWYNVKGLIEASEVVDANGLKSSPFAVKESIGYLRAAGAFKKDGDATTQKLQLHDKVAKALKSGVGVNAVREVVAKAKALKPETFPPSKKGSKKPEAPVIGGKVMDGSEVAREIQSCVGLWDKAIAQGVPRAKLIELCKTDVESLAKLAGFSLAPLS